MESSELNKTVSTSALSDWTRATILRLKKSNSSEKSELQRLNSELKTYLGNVQVLEELNNVLLAEVESERKRHFPLFMDKSEHNVEIQKARSDLEIQSLGLVEQNLLIEEAQSATQDLTVRAKFHEVDSDLSREKIFTLRTELGQMVHLKTALLEDVASLNEIVNREEEKATKAFNETEKLRKALSSSKYGNKKIEFEIDTLRDEIIFSKEVHREELEEWRKHAEATDGAGSHAGLGNAMQIILQID